MSDFSGEPADEVTETHDETPTPESSAGVAGDALDREGELEALVAERTGDLQRLQAEYVNYKRRVDRDREVARALGVAAVMGDLLGVLDGLQGARAHGEYEGPVRMLGDEVEKVTAKYGVTAFGEKGEPFDPQLHEALMHTTQPGITVTTCVDVPQVGYRIGERILRPARVIVADPEGGDQAHGSPAESEPEPGDEL